MSLHMRVAGRIRRRLRAYLSGFWNLTIAAGEAVPGIGGFMKVAGGIFVTLIEPVQDNSQTTLRRLSIIEEREEDMCKGVVVLRCWSEGDADNSKVYLEVAFHLYVSYQRRKAVHDGAKNLKLDINMAGEDIKCWSSSLVRPDGLTVADLRMHYPSILVDHAYKCREVSLVSDIVTDCVMRSMTSVRNSERHANILLLCRKNL
ncbi:hypothetical protein M422DRAFT_247402 [Sphaerobolus stellatus SS14]|nr:hypothetical protein M422DRAFT_247402 [Sphaerobolus stellatus SS14]